MWVISCTVTIMAIITRISESLWMHSMRACPCVCVCVRARAFIAHATQIASHFATRIASTCANYKKQRIIRRRAAVRISLRRDTFIAIESWAYWSRERVLHIRPFHFGVSTNSWKLETRLISKINTLDDNPVSFFCSNFKRINEKKQSDSKRRSLEMAHEEPFFHGNANNEVFLFS